MIPCPLGKSNFNSVMQIYFGGQHENNICTKVGYINVYYMKRKEKSYVEHKGYRLLTILNVHGLAISDCLESGNVHNSGIFSI